MIDRLKTLIEALREELKNYGEMLVLLERQQDHLLSRSTSDVTESIGLIQKQGEAIHLARQQRDDGRRALAREAGREETTGFMELLPSLPADYRPLLKALVDENNELLFRVRRKARQNHLILRRSVELMQDVMNTLRPRLSQPVCADPGQPRGRSRATRRLHEELN